MRSLLRHQLGLGDLAFMRGGKGGGKGGEGGEDAAASGAWEGVASGIRGTKASIKYLMHSRVRGTHAGTLRPNSSSIGKGWLRHTRSSSLSKAGLEARSKDHAGPS